MVLYVLTYVYHNGPVDAVDVHNVTEVERQLSDYAAARGHADDPLGALAAEWPPFCVVTEPLSDGDVARLYNAGDAFVLPTRGEGWGLPLLQAMALGKPTVAPNWGGQTAFMTPSTSFLLEVDGLDEIPPDSPYKYAAGKKWAVPSVADTARVMRLLADDPAFGRAVGRRARAHAVAKFSEAAVAAVVDSRLRDIAAFIRHAAVGGKRRARKPTAPPDDGIDASSPS